MKYITPNLFVKPYLGQTIFSLWGIGLLLNSSNEIEWIHSYPYDTKWDLHYPLSTQHRNFYNFINDNITNILECIIVDHNIIDIIFAIRIDKKHLMNSLIGGLFLESNYTRQFLYTPYNSIKISTLLTKSTETEIDNLLTLLLSLDKTSNDIAFELVKGLYKTYK